MKEEAPIIEKEQGIEWLMKPLRQLLECEALIPAGRTQEAWTETSWHVFVEWKEPDIDAEGRILKWNTFDASGPLNPLFIKWARTHYLFWLDKAFVPLRITKIIDLKEGEMDKPRRSW